MERWFLEGFIGSEEVIGQLPLTTFPFRVGRREGLSFTVPRLDVSRVHAEFDQVAGSVILRDLGSTNGTYVNRRKLKSDVILQDGDVIHFANLELRLIKQSIPSTDTSKTLVGMETLSEKLGPGIRELQELLDSRAVTAVYQPIVTANQADVYGYEILGRGTHAALPRDPSPLFEIAATVGKAVELSELFRQYGLDTAATFPNEYKYFINIHPEELTSLSRLLASIEELRSRYPQLLLVLEVHEQAVSDIGQMKSFGEELAQMGVELAYDDFGAGQARMLELVDVPVGYLKFDISLISDIDRVPQAHREMVSMLLTLARRMNISTLAEGVDRKEEVEVCKELGFDYLQGYHFGRPVRSILQGS
ncbi:MAG: EAL domain-containing protein [Arenicellales bacterium]|nr:EAL domain-containing protein [Arenicellales bacterium]